MDDCSLISEKYNRQRRIFRSYRRISGHCNKTNVPILSIGQRTKKISEYRSMLNQNKEIHQTIISVGNR